MRLTDPGPAQLVAGAVPAQGGREAERRVAVTMVER
jgi:hypothetical protein